MEKFALTNMHDFCLVQVRADRAMRVMVSGKLEAQGLTLMEWLALGVIAGGSKHGLSMSETAAELNVTLPQVTTLVSGLLEPKFIKQKVLASDHRGRQVFITLKGKRVLAKLENSVARGVRDWTKEIPTARMQEYMRTVQQLSKI